MPDSTTPLQQEYVVKFFFTTFDMRKSMMNGRNGRINIVSSVPKDEINQEEIKSLCLGEVHKSKPKWNILSMEIKSISPLVPKKKRSKVND